MIFYGAGGHTKVLIEGCRAIQNKPIAVFDDNTSLSEILSIPVYKTYSPSSFPEEKIIIGIGNNTIRKKLVGEVTHKFGSLIHPKAFLSESATIGEGTAVLLNSIVNTETKIGNHCIINTSAIVDHNCIINDFVHIAPNATLCGHVEVGELTLIGAGATITPSVKIGKNVIIGAGRTVTKDVPDHTIVTNDWV